MYGLKKGAQSVILEEESPMEFFRYFVEKQESCSLR